LARRAESGSGDSIESDVSWPGELVAARCARTHRCPVDASGAAVGSVLEEPEEDEMTDAFVVRYRATAEAAEENQRLVEAVFAELATTRPPGLEYAVYRLADGVTFVHIASGDREALGRVAAFQEFQRDGDERREAAPDATSATVVGAYRG
jgi:hypothetical protein